MMTKAVHLVSRVFFRTEFLNIADDCQLADLELCHPKSNSELLSGESERKYPAVEELGEWR